MHPRTYPLVSALALAASVVLMALPPQAQACAGAKPAAVKPAAPPAAGTPGPAGTSAAPAPDPRDPRFAEQMVERYRAWGATR